MLLKLSFFHNYVLIETCDWINDRTDSITSCSIGRHTTGSTQNQDSVQFGSMIGSTSNPFEISFSQWNVRESVYLHKPKWWWWSGVEVARWSRSTKLTYVGPV